MSYTVRRPMIAAVILLAVSVNINVTDAQTISDPSLCNALSSQKNAWQCKYTKSATVGLLLENTFSEMLKSCSISLLARQKVILPKQALLSSIPYELQRPSLLSQKVWSSPSPLDGFSIERLFSSVFETERLLPKDLVKLKVFNQEYSSSNPGVYFEGGTNTLYFATDCSRVVSSALSVNSKLSFPGISIDTLVKLQTGGTSTLASSVYIGQFTSPYVESFTGPNDGPNKFFSLIKLWNWYSRNLKSFEGAKKTRYIMEGFRGAVVFRYEEVQNTAEFTSDFKIPFDFPGISTTVGANSNLVNRSTLKATSYDVAILVPEDNSRAVPTKPLPNVYSTRDQLAAYSTSLSLGYDKIASALNGLAPHVQIMENLPRNDCTQKRFTAQSTSAPFSGAKTGDVSYVITKAEYALRVDKDGKAISPICSFTVIPSLKTPPAATSGVTLRYSFVSTLQALDLKVELAIPAEPVSYIFSK